MDEFLQSVEKKAYRMAVMATKHPDDAFDIVQNAMLKLVKNYSDKNEDELKALFYRILQNEINNWANRQGLFKRWFGKPTSQYDNDENSDIFGNEATQLEVTEQHADVQLNPEQKLDHEQVAKALTSVLEALPIKQQQCFLLRNWEGLSVKTTASIMNCSEGSVKTHLSRALTKLKEAERTFVIQEEQV